LEKEREKDHKFGNAWTADKGAIPVYISSFNKAADLKFGLGERVCVCYHFCH
jgi:hypothetical protein